jgi:phosphate-selective porin
MNIVGIFETWTNCFFHTHTHMKRIITISILTLSAYATSIAQSTNDVLNVLIENKLISAEQADSLRAEAAIKQQDELGKQKSFPLTGSRKFQIGGYGQIRYQYLQIDSKPNASGVSKSDGFDVRRAYLDIKGNLSPYWAYRFQADFAGSPKLIDAYADLKLKDYINFTFGQQLIPFSIDNLTSNTKSDFIDRSQVTEALVARGGDVIGNQNGRDIGITAGGSFIKKETGFLIDYRLGVYNGQGINVADNNENKDVVGRLIFYPIAGLDLGASYLNGTGNYKVGTATVPTNETRDRFGVELNYEYKRFSLRGEYIEGKDGSVKKNGYYGQAGYYILPQALQVVGKYDVYDKNADANDDISTNYVLGLNYTFNAFTRLQASYTFREEEGTKIDNDYAAIQLQLVF